MKCQRDKFLLQGKVTYLNGAYMSPLLKKVEKAGIKGIIGKRKPYRIPPEDFFWRIRNLKEVIRLFNKRFGPISNSHYSVSFLWDGERGKKFAQKKGNDHSSGRAVP